MQDQRARDTAPELAVRRLVHAAGLRYRVDRAPLPALRRRADLVFGPARLAVFIDGCFWHGCPEHGTRPKTNQQWWAAKLDRNRQRDRDTDERLLAAGWQVLRIWEHEPPDRAAALIRDAVRQGRPTHRALPRQGARADTRSGPPRPPASSTPACATRPSTGDNGGEQS